VFLGGFVPKIAIKLDGELIKQVSLTKNRTTLGRRPNNDVVLEDLAVSGRHACLILEGQQVTIEDLDSTNGTYVNGRSVKKQLLEENDTIEIGHFNIVFSVKSDTAGTLPDNQSAPAQEADWPLAFSDLVEPSVKLQGRIKVISGGAAGREMPLTKPVTTFGKPSVAVAAITRREANYYVHHVEGTQVPLLNGTAVGETPILLKHGDQISLSGTVLQFLLS
jgi:pSer/pThr/pTyr-binding forkhead associated (FHA) protein